MIELLKTFNQYFKYIYIPVILVLLGMIIYLLIELLKMKAHITYLTDGLGKTKIKLEKSKDATTKIQNSLNRDLPVIMGGLGILSLLKITKKAMKNKKKNDKSLLSNILDEYNAKQNKNLKRKEIIGAAKAVVPIVNSARKIITK